MACSTKVDPPGKDNRKYNSCKQVRTSDGQDAANAELAGARKFKKSNAPLSLARFSPAAAVAAADRTA